MKIFEHDFTKEKKETISYEFNEKAVLKNKDVIYYDITKIDFHNSNKSLGCSLFVGEKIIATINELSKKIKIEEVKLLSMGKVVSKEYHLIEEYSWMIG